MPDEYPWPIPADELCRRYLGVYTPAVSDVLDRLGHREQVLPPEIRPLDPQMQVAGPAFTARGIAVRDDREEYIQFAIEGYARAAGIPGPVIVIDASGDRTAAHWGELLSNSARSLGASGTVVAGGVRDVDRIVPLGYPVFAEFTTPADIRGRWRYVDFGTPLRLGDVTVGTWDYVRGDVNGVVVVPRDLVVEVLEQAERVLETEHHIRAELRAGENPVDVYAKYGTF